MRRKSLYLFALCFLALGYASLHAQDGLNLPSVTPINPETASLGRYGNVPINMGTGQMSYTIPIHTIQVDGNSWSVSLNYNYSGLILEAAPSLTGLGWGLNAHGAVRREIRGLVDGHEDGYYGVHDIQNKIPDFSDPSWNKYSMNIIDFQKFRDGAYDSEADKYTLSAGGMQVSFKLYYDDITQKFEPYYLTHQNNHIVKVNMDPAAWHKVASFELITDGGVSYFFEDQETVYCEPGGVSVCPEDNANAWLLSKIHYLNGEEITFNYIPQTYFTYNFQAKGLVVRQDIDGSGIVPVDEAYDHNIIKNQVNRLLLNSIDFPKGRIDFNTVTTGGRTLYNNITVKAKNANGTLGDTVEDYTFTYSEVRDLLTSVTKNQELLFGFDYYDDPSGNMPPFVSDTYYPLDQDQWRYYNDGNNTHFFNMGVNGINADRSINFNKTRLGAMKSINYPTGGRTDIYYEQNQVQEIYIPGTPGEGNTGYDNTLLVDINASLSNNDREDIRTVTFTEPVVAEISHKIIGDMIEGTRLRMGFEKIAEAGNPININDCYQYQPIFSSYYPRTVEDARNKVIAGTGEDNVCAYYPNPPLTPFYIAEYGPDGCAGNDKGCVSIFYVDQEDSTRGSIVILPGTYRITVSTNTTNGDGSTTTHFVGGELSAHIQLKWRNNLPSGETNNDPTYINKDVGGIRVSKMINVPIDGKPVERLFNYHDISGKSSGTINFNPRFVFDSEIHIIHQGGDLEDKFIQTYLTTAFSFLNTGEGIPVYYTRVEEYAPNLSKTITEYNDQFDRAQYQYPIIPSEEFNSKLLPKTIYKRGRTDQLDALEFPDGPLTVNIDLNEDGSYPEWYITVEQTNIEYFRSRKHIDNIQQTPEGVPFTHRRDVSQNHPWSFKLVPKKIRHVDFQTFDYPVIPSANDPAEVAAHMDLHAFYPYKEVHWNSRTESQTKIYSGITEQTSYTYNEKKYPIVTETIDSKGDTLTVNNIYAFDAPVASEQQYASMVANNQINTPVLTQTAENGAIRSTQKVNFTSVIDGYKPQSIETAKTGNTSDLEERVVYEDYDANGNVSQVRKANGQPISYLWGYSRQYPVAKIENATITEVLASGGSNIQHLDGASLRSALDAIRQGLPEALVTSYTYKPLVGVTSVTDPRGYTMFYEYDAQNRLKYVKDQDGKVYSKNEYNYSSSN